MAFRKYTDEERKQKNRESSRKYWKNHLEECRKKRRESSRKYREQNPEKIKQSRRERYSKSREADLEGWRKKSRENARKYRTLEKRIEFLLAGNVTRQELIELFERSNECCFYCGEKIKRPYFTPHAPRGFDHVIPFCKGGKHEISNMVVCCKECNVKKGRKIL